MVKCKLCGGEYKSLEMHLTSCLKKYKITREQYSELPDPVNETDEIKEVEEGALPEAENAEEVVVTPKTLKENVFKTKKRDPDRPLSEALTEWGISEGEFIVLLKKWKGEGGVPVEMRMKQKMVIGEGIAETFKKKDYAEVPNAEAAEILIKYHDFKCIEVRSPKGTAPKTWVLKRNG